MVEVIDETYEIFFVNLIEVDVLAFVADEPFDGKIETLNNGFLIVRTEKETVAVFYNHGANIYAYFGDAFLVKLY